MPDAAGPQPAQQLEIERKFDVDFATAVPSFVAVGPVARIMEPPAQLLDAVYFDTPGHDLAARRITLRRRSGGADAGWHLKLPAGADARTEVHAPSGDSAPGEEVPAALRDLVLAIVRERPLVPAAHITTTRAVRLLYDAGDVLLAEFCDDRVTASAPDSATGPHRWREWELELTAGDVALLDQLTRRVRDAGATPAAHGSKLARVLGRAAPPPSHDADPIRAAVAEQVEHLLVCDRDVRTGGDDAVHQMRVAIRRLRSLLRAQLGEPDRWLLTELRQLAAVLGRARDAQVLAERYRAALDRLAPEVVRGPVRQRLVGAAVQRYDEGWRESLAVMRSPRYFRLLDGLEDLLTGASVFDGSPPDLTAARRRVTKAAKAARHTSGSDRDDALHRVRKAAKRLRYLADAAGADSPAREAKAVQSLLGDHQDSVVSRGNLLEQAAAAHRAGEDTFTYGILYQQEAELARRRRAELGPALARLRRAGERVGL